MQRSPSTLLVLQVAVDGGMREKELQVVERGGIVARTQKVEHRAPKKVAAVHLGRCTGTRWQAAIAGAERRQGPLLRGRALGWVPLDCGQ